MTEHGRFRVPSRPASDAAEPRLSVPARSEPFAVPAVVQTKVQPPATRGDILHRRRLTTWLDDHAQERLKLIVAEAGYGKTTLLAEYARSTDIRCLWYRLDPNDRDWVTFSNYIVAAVREAHPDFGRATATLLAQLASLDPSREVVVGSLISELSTIDDRRTMLIIDDLHHVDDTADVDRILTRLLHDLPSNWSLVITSRRRPRIPLGRYAAQGDLAELTTSDLRFSRAETEALFAVTYRQPLDDDLLAQIDARTEGWPASLRLLYSSIRGRGPSETREFIRAMSGAGGSLYDFLAEEVLAQLPDELERFVVHASLLERIVPAHVAAILSAPGRPVGTADVHRWMEQADALGLLARSSASSSSARFHPLLEEFLRRQLEMRTAPDELRAMHARVARAAGSDWLAAAHHFIEAADESAAIAVLAESLLVVVGSGLWGAATKLLRRLPPTAQDGRLAVIHARELMADSREQEALDLLSVAPQSDPLLQAVIRRTQAALLWRMGSIDDLSTCLHETVTDPSTPAELRALAEVHLLQLTIWEHGSYSVLVNRLLELADNQRRSGHRYFAAVSLYNALLCLVGSGRHGEGLEVGEAALREFSATEMPQSERYSTYATMATAALELGRADLGQELIDQAVSGNGVEDADALAECCVLAAITGDINRAQSLLVGVQRRIAEGRADYGSRLSEPIARSTIALTTGRFREAIALLDAEGSGGTYDHSWAAQRECVRVLAKTCLGVQAPDDVREALHRAERLGAWRLAARLRLALAVQGQSSPDLLASIGEAAASGHLALLETADALATVLHRLERMPDAVTLSVQAHPRRWLPVLRRQLDAGGSPAGHAAAKLLAQFGEAGDAPRLRAYEHSYMRRSKGELTRRMVRRVSPRLHIHDLGRISLEVGERLVPVVTMRRKAASLLVYLLTRPNATATKEQVMDELWPEQDPSSGANSLHQTLYFLRRDIDPWYEDGLSADYVRNESELVWLDSELVTADSITFRATAADARRNEGSAEARALALGLYRGRFASEFEYEEWAIGLRDALHATYLGVVASEIARRVEDAEYEAAIAVAQSALVVAPEALEIERDLVWLYGVVAQTAAAAEQYHRYAGMYTDATGEEPPSLRVVLASPPPYMARAGRDTP